MESDELDQKLENLYQSAQSASSEGLREEALRMCQDALALLEANGEDTEQHTFSEFVMLTGDVYWSAGDYEDAYQAYHKVAMNDPERNDARIAMGVALYHLCRFAAAQGVLEMATLDDPDAPEAWYYLGLLALRHDKEELAYSHFDVAHELDENRYPLPVRIKEAEITALVSQMIDEIPEELAEAIHNLPIILEKRPSEELLFDADPPMDPTVLGIFDGVPLTDQSSFDTPTTPTRIVLFSENISLVAHDRATLEEELWITLKHELGHFLGLSEEELTERGLD